MKRVPEFRMLESLNDLRGEVQRVSVQLAYGDGQLEHVTPRGQGRHEVGGRRQ